MKVVKNKDISLKAKGLYFLLKDMIDNEEVISLATICENCTDKETSLRGAIQELIDNGYLERNMIREKGKIKGVSYKILK